MAATLALVAATEASAAPAKDPSAAHRVTQGSPRIAALDHDYTSCETTPQNCVTLIISANQTYHQLHYEVWPGIVNGTSWIIVDVDTGAIVSQGRIGLTGTADGVVRGLYGRYYLYCFASGWQGGGEIDNYIDIPS